MATRNNKLQISSGLETLLTGVGIGAIGVLIWEGIYELIAWCLR